VDGGASEWPIERVPMNTSTTSVATSPAKLDQKDPIRRRFGSLVYEVVLEASINPSRGCNHLSPKLLLEGISRVGEQWTYSFKELKVCALERRASFVSQPLL
jgi:hypothetical protein